VRQPARLRTIYGELRRALGADAPAGDLLRLAHVILRAYNEEGVEPDGFEEAAESRAFLLQPVDKAMSDGGWRVLEFELERATGPDDIDPEQLADLRRYIERFLGPEWQQRIPPG
jgi:hypothetical protein